MHELGMKISRLLQAGDLVVLTGPLGAGKTTMTRGVGEGLTAIGNVSSPTFVIARTHKRKDSGPALVHVDAYRLGSALELDDLDIDFENSIVLVEWGKGMTDDLVENWLEVIIERERAVEHAADESESTDPRTVTILGFGPRWAEVSLGEI
ncbi:MAG: tRNA (adenosine(37)-N6)-threonylcarbamoyltransferase complex ATPase subunit type 1 TsaE [Rhodoluna sp.]